MTTFNLGTVTISTIVEEDVDRLGVTGPSSGAFNPGHRSYRWPVEITGPLDEAPVPTIQPASSVASNAAILNALVDPRGCDTTVFFEYGTAVDTNGEPVFGSHTSSIELAAGYGDQAVGIPVASLTASTTYYARAVATSTNGTEPATSGFVTFQTLVDTSGGTSGPPIVDANPAVVGVPTQTAITVIASFDMNGASGQIHLERLIGSTWTDIAAPVSAPVGIQSMTATATGLTAGTSYQFRARATNPNAPEPNGTISSTLTAQTAAADPTLPVPTLLASGTPALTSITVNGRISSYTEVPVRWQFQYGLTTAYGSTTALQIDSAVPVAGFEDVSALISGLVAETTYHYRLVAMRIDNAGGNQFSADGTFTTATPPDPTLPVPTLLSPGTLTSTSAVANGRIDNIAEVPAKYQFEYGTTTSYGSTTTLVTDAVIPVGGSETVQATITGLSASTLYHYRLNATRTDDAGGAQHSIDGTFTTTAAAAAILPVPGPLAATGVTQSAASLNGVVAQITSQSGVSMKFEYGTTTSYGSSTTITSIQNAVGNPSLVSVQVSGTVNPQNQTTSLFIDYGTDPDNLNQTQSYGQIVGTGAKSFTAVIPGLAPNTIYWFRARATNAGGTSVSTMRPTRCRTVLAVPEVAYHISPAGNNTTGDGSALSPWKTIQKVASTPGATTCIMHTGQYAGQTITSKPAALLTIKDAGDGVVDLDFVSIQSAGNLNFEGNIKASGWNRPDTGTTLIFEAFGTPTTKAGPVYWAAGNITAIGKVGGSTNAPVCIRASSDADNVYFDGVQTQGGGFAVKSFTNATPSSSFATGWRFTGCNFGPDHTWDVVHIGGSKNWRFIDCQFHDPKSLGGYVTGNTSEEHHDGFGQVQYSDDVKWIGGKTYDHTNPAVTSPGSALLLNADVAGAVVSNMMVVGHVLESWSGGGLNVTNGGGLKFLQTTIGAVTGTGDGVHPANAGSTADVAINTAATGVTFRGVNAREQFVSGGAAAFTANDKNFWRSSSSRAGTNAKSGAVTFVSTTDLHLANGTQAAATGGPIPTDDSDILAWDTEGRGYGPDPAIGAYASPTVTSPLFGGVVTCSPLLAEHLTVQIGASGLSASTTYHYRLSALRADSSGGSQVSTDATFTTQSATLVTTQIQFGPVIPVVPTSTVSGGTFVVKSDGKIYDSGGTTLQDMTSKEFSSLVTIKSDTAGTRRNLNPALLNQSRFAAGLVLTELVGNDPSANWEVRGASTTYALDMQGCSGRWGHARIVNYAHNGLRLTQSASSVVCGATGSTWDTDAPDLRIDNFTFHGSSADGSAVVAVKARNVLLGGVDPGTQSSPVGLSGPAFLFDGSALDDVQDVRVGVALDGTTSIVGSSSGTYTFHLLDCRRSGWNGALDNPVLFTNTTGQRPEKPVWLGSTDGDTPGSETVGGTTIAKIACSHPWTKNGVAQNLVSYTFRNSATGLQQFEVDASVWDPAVSLSMWSSVMEQSSAIRFIDGREALGARVSGTATVFANKGTVTDSFTLSGGAAGSVGRSGDNWFEVRGVKFDPGQPGAQIWTGTTVFTTDQSDGLQLKAAPAAQQAGGVLPTIPPWTGSPGGGVDLKVTNADGSTPASFVVVNNKGKTTNLWPVPHGNDADPDLVEWICGIYTNYVDPGTFPLGGVDAVEPGVGYRRQLGYQGYDAANSKFTGVVVIPGPSGGAINPEPGEVLTVTAATPGVVTTFTPHGMATNDRVTITGNTQAAANGTFKITRITPTTFSLQTTAGVNVAIPSAGTGGAYTPLGPNGTGYKYGLTKADGSSPFPTSLVLPAGTTLDGTMNDNYGQPVLNATVNVGADSVGKGIRFIGCDFYDSEIQGADSNIKCEIVDCTLTVSPLYGKGIDYTTVDNGVVGTYDSSNQHDPPRMLGALNVLSPTEGLWLLDRFKVTGAHGDIAPGKFAIGSVMRHCRWVHGRDCRNASPNNAKSRDGISAPLLPKMAPGPHGDLFQNYDRNSITAIGNDLSTVAHSLWFSRSQAGTNYKVVTGINFTNDGAGHFQFILNNHGSKIGDKVLITGTGDGTLDNHEFVVTNINTNIDKNNVILGGTTFTANRAGTVTFVVHYFVDWRRNDLRTLKHWDATDLTFSTHIKNKGAVSFQQTEDWVANTVTMQAKFYDNRWDTVDGALGSWQLRTPVTGTTIDLGTPNRNLARTYGLNNGFVPGGPITPIYQ